MSNKKRLSQQQFISEFGNSGFSDITKYIVAEKIGKVVFTTAPWTLRQSQSKPSTTRFVLDFEKNKYSKYVDGKLDHEEKMTVGELIGDFVGFIAMLKRKPNEYESIDLYNRTTPQLKNETTKLTPNQVKLKKVIKPIVEGILNEATFNEAEFKTILEKASTDFWKGYNELAVAMRYLQTSGQGGLVGAFRKKIRMLELQDIFENFDAYIDSK